MIRIAWDISHQEFTIEDHYYFSKLNRELKNRGVEVFELDKFSDVLKENVSVLVLNYPEKAFNKDDLKTVQKFLVLGGRVLILGYYKNEDHVADTINSLTKHFGLLLRTDWVYDPVNNRDGDELFVVTSKIYHFNEGVSKVLFPCVASVEIINKEATKVAKAEDTAKSSLGVEPILMAKLQLGKGLLVLGGTCVFWDNYSITEHSNLVFSLNLLLK